MNDGPAYNPCPSQEDVSKKANLVGNVKKSKADQAQVIHAVFQILT